MSVPHPDALRQLSKVLPPELSNDVWMAYTGISSLRFAGFLVTERRNLNKPFAFCPIGGGLEPGSSLWRRDVRRQFLLACRSAASKSQSPPIDAVNLSTGQADTDEVQPWLYGLSCVPLSFPWDGKLKRPRPFCPKMFTEMAAQPEARHWLLLHQSEQEAPSFEGRGLSASGMEKLNRRQAETLVALRSGLSEGEIARALSLSRHTVHGHVKAIYRALGVNTRSQLLASFIKA